MVRAGFLIQIDFPYGCRLHSGNRLATITEPDDRTQRWRSSQAVRGGRVPSGLERMRTDACSKASELQNSVGQDEVTESREIDKRKRWPGIEDREHALRARTTRSFAW